MARLQFGPVKQTSHRRPVGLALAGCLFSLPASAATPHHDLCSESERPSLEVHFEALAAEIVSHSLIITSIETKKSIDEVEVSVHEPVLEPRARQAVREAFSDELITVSGEEEAIDSDSDDAEIEEAPPRVMNTQLPGVTQEKLDRYKRQMYRRDI